MPERTGAERGPARAWLVVSDRDARRRPPGASSGEESSQVHILRRDPVHRVAGCWFVRGSRMLHNLDEQTVEAMIRRSAVASFRGGEFLHEAGIPMAAVTFINHGRVKVYRISRDGKQQTIALLGPGDAFGEIGMVDRSPQDLYVEALEPVTVCRTTRDDFLQLASRDPVLAIRLAEAMGEKLQEARERIADFAFRDVRGRTARLLLAYLERDGAQRAERGAISTELGLTHRDLADIIGTRRESVTIALNSLEREGIIRFEGRRLFAVDVERLREIAAA